MCVCRDIAFQLQQDQMVAALKGKRNICFLPFFKECLVEKRQKELFQTLDHGEDEWVVVLSAEFH